LKTPLRLFVVIGKPGSPRPLDRAFAFFDPLLARAALVVEGDDILGGSRHVGDDEADARIEFARMPFDLGDHPAQLRPASGLIGEACMSPDNGLPTSEARRIIAQLWGEGQAVRIGVAERPLVLPVEGRNLSSP
jgi:hypothetical protein